MGSARYVFAREARRAPGVRRGPAATVSHVFPPDLPTATTPDPPLHRDAQVQELTRHNQELVHALDAKERECAELSAALETGGDRLAAGVRESKIVEMARKNRSLTLAVEKEKAEKARLVTELKAARAGTGRAPGGLHAGAERYEDGTPRTESQIEKACREVVAEAAKAAEDASKERAEWKDKAREASARAERDAGRYNTVRAENDRLRAIIKREVGDDKVDFTKLEKSLEAAGGWRGRAREVATLRHKVKHLRDRLEAYEDGVVSVASTVSRFATARDADEDAPSEVGFDAGSRPGTAATDASRRTARSFAVTHETAREASARRRQLEEATAALAASEAACEDARAKARAAGARRDALERDVRGLREKLGVLKEKSAHDDRLIDALRAENRRARGEAEEALLRETAASTLTAADSTDPSRPRGGFAGASVPVSVYKTAERRAERADARTREREQQVLQLRAKIASLENDATRDATRLTTCSRASSIAAAAADTDPDLPDVSLQHQEDVAALIEHAEALERETAALRGRLAVAEQTERTLRARLGAKDHETHELKTRLTLTMTGGTDREKTSTNTTNTKDDTTNGCFKASTADITDDVSDEESRVASLKARLASSEAELERVRRASRERIESMEKEVELYFEMAEEMKRTMRGDGVC